MRILRRAAHWKIPLVLALACGIVALLGEDARTLLRYERSGLQDAEYWRLLSGHLTHLGPSHLLLNLAGLVLVWLLVGRSYADRGWLLVILASVLAVDAGFWFLDTNLRWYVGLSGLLHGLLVAGAIRTLRRLPAEAGILLGAVIVKLVYEQWFGPLPGSVTAAGGAIVVNAHLYGAAGGVAAGVALRRSVPPAAPI